MRFCTYTCVFLALFIPPSVSADVIDFNRDIRPLLADYCFKCHGPDEGTLEADLRLDTRDGALADLGGRIAIVPNKPEQSVLLKRITASDPDERMPPPEAGKMLGPEQIALLRAWIEQGAPYASHWSFDAIRRPPLPPLNDAAGSSRHAIDHFVQAKLEELGITPSEEADRHTLIRRVYLDFLGVPPTVDQVAAFVSDNYPAAFERLMDRVLADPRFGERWGRHWLDQARYADSHGYTNDNARIMWPYRDWVINAFNRDVPFDQFTTEQLAGDLLDEPTLDQLVATGFHRNTLINSEGGTKADQFRDEQVKDRVDTTGLVWLGLTVGCAKCHSHKYDPISQTEYYQIYSFFNSTADSNSTSPTIQAPSSQQQQMLARLDQQIAALRGRLEGDAKREQRQSAWEAELVETAQRLESDASAESVEWTVLELDGQSDNDATFTRLDDNSLLVSGNDVARDWYKLTARSPLTSIRSVRVEALRHESLPLGGPGRAGNGNFVLSEFWFRTGDGRELRFSKAQADHSQPKYDVAHAIDTKPNTGWAINGSPEGGANHNRVAWFVLPAPLEVEEEHALIFNMQFDNGDARYNLGRFRISIAADEWVDMPSVGELAKLASVPPADRTKAQSQRLTAAFLKSDPLLSTVNADLERLSRQRDGVARQIPSTMILRELDKPRSTYLQVRGDFLRTGEPVAADVPAVLPPLPDSEAPRTRLDLAAWLVSDTNPLTPRVRINRMWMRLFGRGLVETENDFGIQGSLPSHPQLLDWLASEFRRQEWSTKRMLRQIAMSATYRQSSVFRKDLPVEDAGNEWLARQARLRVEGEIVRDLALAVSGLLSNKIGGPSVYPPQPDGVYAFTQRSMSWKTSRGEDRFRRGMYTFFYRSAPYPMLTTFDAPTFNVTCTRRDRSNTPLQSLTVANSEAMMEMAKAFAQRIQAEADDDEQRLVKAFQICFARPPSQQELTLLARFLEAAQQRQQSQPSFDPWVATARVLMNLDEFVTRE